MSARTSLLTLIQNELAADAYDDDVTARLLPASELPVRAEIRAKENGVFCGESIVAAFGDIVGRAGILTLIAKDGDRVQSGDLLLKLELPGALCLSIERTLLNLLGMACGTATLTRRYVDAVEGCGTRILATRKTIPGLRALQLEAVRAGGGWVHRRSLSDGILIKENHQQFVLPEVLLDRARATRSPLHRIEIEVQDAVLLSRVLEHSPDVIMLDNFSVEGARKALREIGGRCEVEISGGINLETVRGYAELGVQYISVGRLTHSAPALDISLDIRTESV